MSELNQSTQTTEPMGTRREILDQCQRDGRKHPDSHSIHEPLPEYEDSSYTQVQLRPDRLVFQNRGFIIATLTMVLVSSVLFFAPLLNGLMGGVFGGFYARRWGRALASAAVASVAVPGLFLFLYGWDTPDLNYMFYGLGFGGFAALHILGTFLGALAGVASRPLEERLRARTFSS
jgi:hypothetical protein